MDDLAVFVPHRNRQPNQIERGPKQDIVLGRRRLRRRRCRRGYRLSDDRRRDWCSLLIINFIFFHVNYYNILFSQRFKR